MIFMTNTTRMEEAKSTVVGTKNMKARRVAMKRKALCMLDTTRSLFIKIIIIFFALKCLESRVKIAISFQDHHGAEKKHEGSHQHNEKKGHKSAEGHDSHHEHDEKYGHKGGQASGHKWSKSNHR